MFVIAPAFQDLTNTDMFQGTLPEFTLMDNVKSKAPIIDIKRTQNILQRRDTSCDLNYKKLMGATNRIITVDELYAATKQCKNAFYTDALKDWRNGDPLFGNRILPFFKRAVATDVLSNAWFGDISRIKIVNSEWSTTEFDGVFKWIQTYFNAGVIRAEQGFNTPVTDMRANPATAYGIIKSLYDKQNPLMRAYAPTDKAFYVHPAIAEGYKDYLRSLGNGDKDTLIMYANGVSISTYNGIPIIPEPTWEPIMYELYGENKTAAILTLRGNMVFATDKEYGEGENLDQALMVWYEKKDLSWYFQQFLKAGTQIALPEFIVFAVPA